VLAVLMDDVKDKASEPVTLSRGTVWMLRIAAVTGVASLISHGVDAINHLLP
jgi:hypothetical protein